MTVRVLIGILSLATAGAASATLTEIDVFEPGDGLATRDDVTGLDWLDLTQTIDLGIDDILAGAGPGAGGWLGAGWRHATEHELCLFLKGIEDLFDCTVPLGALNVTVTFEVWSPVQELVGVTATNTLLRQDTNSIGVYDDEGAGEPDRSSSVRIDLFPVETEARVLVQLDQFMGAHPLLGNWLVRPVPEPGAMLQAFFALSALAALRVLRRRRGGEGAR